MFDWVPVIHLQAPGVQMIPMGGAPPPHQQQYGKPIESLSHNILRTQLPLYGIPLTHELRHTMHGAKAANDQCRVCHTGLNNCK